MNRHQKWARCSWKGTSGVWPSQHVPVEAGGDGLLGRDAGGGLGPGEVAVVVGEVDAEGVHLADAPVAHQFAAKSHPRVGALHGADLENALVALHRLDDRAALEDGVGQQPLAVDVLA